MNKKGIFFDMKHSNGGARIRLWLKLKGITEDLVETKMIASSAELKSPEFVKINPLKKVPAFVTDHGLPLFESSVIMGYLEDRFASEACEPRLVLDTPDDRALVELIVRCHDLYVTSANCTQPHFSHTQGCMYLDPTETQFTPAHRTMDAKTRAAKLAELYNQLTWLEKTATCKPYLVGNRLTHADLTWFPTMVLMHFMLPRSFGWPKDFLERQFPKVAHWFAHCTDATAAAGNTHHASLFVSVRGDILEEIQKEYDRGWLKGVKEDVQSHPEYKWNYFQ